MTKMLVAMTLALGVDTKADVNALIKATTEAGYPSFLYSEGMLWP